MKRTSKSLFLAMFAVSASAISTVMPAVSTVASEKHHIGATHENGVVKYHGHVQAAEDVMLLSAYAPHIQNAQSQASDFDEAAFGNPLQLYESPMVGLYDLASVLHSQPGQDQLSSFLDDFLSRIDSYKEYTNYESIMLNNCAHELARIYRYTDYFRKSHANGWEVQQIFFAEVNNMLHAMWAATLPMPYHTWEQHDTLGYSNAEFKKLEVLHTNLAVAVEQDDVPANISNKEVNELLEFVSTMQMRLHHAQRTYNECYEKYEIYRKQVAGAKDAQARNEMMRMAEHAVVAVLDAQFKVYECFALIKKHGRQFSAYVEYLEKMQKAIEEIREHQTSLGLHMNLAPELEEELANSKKLIGLFKVLCSSKVNEIIGKLQTMRAKLIDEYQMLVEKKLVPEMAESEFAIVANLGAIKSPHFENVKAVTKLLQELKNIKDDVVSMSEHKREKVVERKSGDKVTASEMGRVANRAGWLQFDIVTKAAGHIVMDGPVMGVVLNSVPEGAQVHIAKQVSGSVQDGYPYQRGFYTNLYDPFDEEITRLTLQQMQAAS